MKAPLSNADKARRSIVFGSHQGERPHSLTREMQDLRNDIEEAFVSLEGGDQLPQIHSVVHDRTNFTVAGNAGKLHIEDLVIAGDNLLGGRVQASAKLFATGSTANFLTLSSIRPGTAGNSLSFEAVNAGAGEALAAAVANGKLTITLATNGGGDVLADGSNSLSNIKTAIDAAFDDDFAAAVLSGDGDDEITAVISESNLLGGTGEGVSVIASQPGQDDKQLKLSAMSDSSITVQDQDLAAAGVVGQVVGIFINSHTGKSNVCFLPVLA